MNRNFSSQADADQSDQLLEQVREALVRRTPLDIRGGGSKAFLGRPVKGQSLSLEGYRGIVAYDPSELVITARVGTPLCEVQEVLAHSG